MNFNCQFLSVFLLSLFFFCSSCKKNQTQQDIENLTAEKSEFEIIAVYAHDVNSFTEGLFFDDGNVFESTGSPDDLPNTKSVFGILDLKTGLINVKAQLDRSIFFGEGITKSKDKIYQLTYKNKVGFIYDSKTYKQIGTFQFENQEGWGLTNNREGTLIMSDGTNVLTFLNPDGFKVINHIEVSENNIPVTNLNELEFVDDYIYANIYTTNKIVKINPSSGLVVRTINLNQLYLEAKNRFPGSLEMNGIAYNPIKKTFLITGKLWPCVFEIKFTE